MKNFNLFISKVVPINLSGIVFSFANVEAILRIVSLIITITVTVIVFVQNQKKQNDEQN